MSKKHHTEMQMYLIFYMRIACTRWETIVLSNEQKVPHRIANVFDFRHPLARKFSLSRDMTLPDTSARPLTRPIELNDVYVVW
jgi:hypothetical protein